MFRDSFHDNKILETVVFPILDSSEIGISIINKEGSILEVNDAFCKLFGFEREEILYKHFSSIIIEENMEYSLKQHHEFMDNGYYDKREVLLKQKNGRFFFAKVTDIKFNDGEGNLYRTTSFLNITEKKQSELIKSILDKLPQEAESGESLESMFRMIHAAAEQLMPAYNFYAAFSNPLNETIEYPYFVNEFCGEDEYREGAAACDELTRYIIQNKRSVLLNEEQLSKFFPVKNNVYNGLAPRSVVGSVLKIKNSVVGAIFLQDFHENNAFSEKHINIIKHLADKISIMLERRNYEEQLIITKEKAEESNRVKTAFLAQMSHEIRTPINTILSFTSLLKEKCEGLLEEELKESFNIIEKGGRRLVRTIDLILNMSQLQSDCFEINPAQIDMAKEIINPVMEEYYRTAREKNLSFSFNNQVVGETVFGDLSMLTQVFEQLIDNAIKFTNKGKIEISQYLNSNGCICISVSDTGVGISKEYLPKLFTPFSQEEIGYTRRFEGNGLGLALVKKYVELNNAHLTVKSEKGMGSTFTVVFQ